MPRLGRPIKPRDVKSYARDHDSLHRLRGALLLDNSLDQDSVKAAVAHIDGLLETLERFMNKVA